MLQIVCIHIQVAAKRSSGYIRTAEIGAPLLGAFCEFDLYTGAGY